MGVGLVVLKPFPLQFEEKAPDRFDGLGYDNFEKDLKKSTKKLEKHYARAGFYKLRGKKLMVLDPWSYGD